MKNKRKSEIRNQYEEWIKYIERKCSPINECELEYRPKISILVPVYNVLDKHLVPCIESVIRQEYSNWELCLVDDCSTWESVRKTLNSYANREKIKVIFRKENGHISECTNTALEAATGEYIALLDCDDVLAPNALSQVVKLLNEDPSLDFIYSDEDKIDDEGKNRHMPHFKSDWAPDTLMSHMYTCHFGVYRRSIALEIGGERKGYEGAQDYDFTLRFTEKTDRIAHIPLILYHWREREESTAGSTEAKPYVLEAARKSKEDAIRRRGLKADIEFVENINQYRVNYIWDEYPKISIIIPSKDNYEILEQCLKSLTETTDYEDYEIIVVDNGSSEENLDRYQKLVESVSGKYIYDKREFNFSYMCNVGAQNADGEYLLFLNDDIEIVDAEWLKRMVGQAMLPHTGAVGAKLLYPDRKTIQHVGIINIENGPVHQFAGYDDGGIYYFGRNIIDYNQIAVTAACLLVKKDKYNQVNGFDEDLAVAYNDVDFCFKLVEEGYYNIVRNDAVLIHHESISRGNDFASEEKMKRLNSEREKLYEKHPKFNKYDPFYNPNLAQRRADFSENYLEEDGLLNKKMGRVYGYIPTVACLKTVIDSVQISDYIQIRGWFHYKNGTKTDHRDVYIVLRDCYGKCTYYEVNRQNRADVAEALNSNVKYAGFICTIPYSELRLNEMSYEIGVMVQSSLACCKRMKWTSRVIEQVPEECYCKKLHKHIAENPIDEHVYSHCNIEKVTNESVVGWALDTGLRDNDVEDFALMYKVENTWYKHEVERKQRPDVAAVYTHIPNCLWSGFVCENVPDKATDLKIVKK